MIAILLFFNKKNPNLASKNWRKMHQKDCRAFQILDLAAACLAEPRSLCISSKNGQYRWYTLEFPSAEIIILYTKATKHMHFEIFSSNRIEVLFYHWRNLLYQKGMHPFQRRFLLAPSPAMKSWLQLQLARDPLCSVAAGLEINSSLECTLQKIQHTLFQLPEKPSYVPSHMELSWIIEALLRYVMTEPWNEQDKAIWQPLLNYLYNAKSSAKKNEQHLLAFASHVADLFFEYGQYAYKMLGHWQIHSSPEWQGKLWHLLKQKFPTVEFLYQQLNTPKAKKFVPPGSVSVHVFAMSFIPQGMHSFLKNISNVATVYYYLLSPCQMFWSDLCSDKERQNTHLFWQKKGAQATQIEALETYLSNQNALLANLGMLGQEMAKLVEESPAFLHEQYVAPAKLSTYGRYAELLSDEMLLQNTNHALTLLEAVQADMLLLCPPHAEKIDFIKDSSIQIHKAPTKQREIEIVYNQLLTILNAHSQDQDTILPGDIIVMAPDIFEYECAIKAVFDSPESLLKYQWLQAASLHKSSLLQAFRQLLNLADSRWEQKSIIAILERPEFQRRHQLSYSDVAQVQEWIKKSGVNWGQNASHRKEALEQAYQHSALINTPYGTWDYALSRLLMGLAVDATELHSLQFNFDLPQAGVENAHIDLFSKWILLFNQLKSDLKSLLTERLPLAEWSRKLIALKNDYLEIDPKNKEAIATELALNAHLAAIGTAENLLPTEHFSFDSLKKQLDKAFKEEKDCSQEGDLQAIRFCSLLSMRAAPAKVIVLIGMSEDSFPRASGSNSLNLMANYAGADYYPSPTNFDRYLFLEALLAARRYFIMSYTSNKEQKSDSSSLLIRELLNYVDHAYTIDSKAASTQCTFDHPFDSFHKTYFEKGARCQTFSKLHYKMAVAHYNSNQKDHYQLIKNYYKPSIAPVAAGTSIVASDLTSIVASDLISFAANPIKTYFNKKLNLYINNKTKSDSTENFVLSALDKYQLRLQAVKEPVKEVLHKASLQGKMPAGMFHKVAVAGFEKEISEMHENFRINDIQPLTLTNLTFSEQHTSQQYCSKKGWMLPPLLIERTQGQRIKIVGTLNDITTQGFLFHQARDLKQILRLWPQMLLLSVAIQQYALPIKPQLISTKHPKPFDFTKIAEEASLTNYLEYYLASLNSLSLLTPEWTASLLKGDESLASIIKAHLCDEFNPCYNAYALWLFQEHSNLLGNLQETPWRDIAYEIYGHVTSHF